MPESDHAMNRAPELTRRTFLVQAAITAAGLGSLPGEALRAPSAEKPKPLPIIDTHQHLWDLKKLRLPWTDGNKILGRSFLMRDYLKAAEGLGVVKTVYMEVAVTPAQQVAEAEYVLALCRKKDNPMVGAVIGGRPGTSEFKAYLRRFKDNPYVKGVRQVLHGGNTPPAFFLGDPFVKGIRLLGEWGMSFDLCVRAADLPAAAKLLDKCPATRFILDHCGNPNLQSKDVSAWKRDIALVAKRKNVVCKVSGFVATAKKDAWKATDLAPVVNRVFDVFGPERVVFGGDWPVCLRAATFKQWVSALQSIVGDRSEKERRMLFHDNAVRVYRLG